MNSLLVTQLVCAFAPGLLGLAVAAVISPRMFRLVAKAFQFDLTTAMLLMGALAVLFAFNRTMRDIDQQAQEEHRLEQQSLREYFNDPNYIHYGSSYRGDYRIAELTLLSIFTVPGLIFARLLIDSYREERRSRAERRERQSAVDVQAALDARPEHSKPEPTKPQWID